MLVDIRPQKVEPRSASGPRELVEEYFMDVYAACFRILGRPQDAEDATQETFLALFRTKEKVAAAPLREEVAAAAPIREPADRERLHLALAGLSEDERHLVQMRFLEGKSPAEMAAASGRNPGTVAVALCRALERLRGLYHGGSR